MSDKKTQMFLFDDYRYCCNQNAIGKIRLLPHHNDKLARNFRENDAEDILVTLNWWKDILTWISMAQAFERIESGELQNNMGDFHRN